MTHACAGDVSGLFSKSAASYAKYRPDYPQELYEAILKRGKPPARELAVDAATGSGQAAKGLSPYFAKVIALDHDSEQLKHAPCLPNVTFQLGAAEDTGLENNTADVIAVAAGLHWFDHDRFYPEAHRILKPGGCLAAWGYDLMTFPENKRAQEELHKLFTFTLGPYWHPRVDHVWQHYRDIEPPQALFSSQHVQLEVDTTMTLSALATLWNQQQQERTAVIGTPVCNCLVLLEATLWRQQQQERTA